jgi:hypothetical protein
MNGRHLIACCCLALAPALGACRQTVVFDRGGGGGSPGDIANFCTGGDVDPVEYGQRTPELVVALDRSWWMSANRFGVGNMSHLEAALASLDLASERFEYLVRLGFIDFPGTGSGCLEQYGCCAGEWFGFFFADARSFQLKARHCEASGSPQCIESEERPTAAALNACRAEFELRGPTNRSRYVLLVTNGEPTCSGALGCAAGTAVTSLRSAMVTTFVVVVGTVGYDSCLRNMATSGDPSRLTPPFYRSATSPEALTSTISSIVEQVARDACQLDLRVPIDNPEQLGLFQDGDGIPKGGADGWTFDDKSHEGIKLQGASCRAFLESPSALDIRRCTERR